MTEESEASPRHSNAKTAALAVEADRGSAPVPPRFIAFGRQQVWGRIPSVEAMCEGRERKQAASEDATHAVWPRRWRSGCVSALPYPPRRAEHLTRCRFGLPAICPPHAGGLNAENLGGAGAEPLPSRLPAQPSALLIVTTPAAIGSRVKQSEVHRDLRSRKSAAYRRLTIRIGESASAASTDRHRQHSLGAVAIHPATHRGWIGLPW